MRPDRKLLIFATVACVFAVQSSAQSRPTVPITVSVTTTGQSYAIPGDFSGLSFGTTSLRGGKNGYFFDSSSPEVVNLFQSLGIRSLRIGGTSVDTNTGNYIPATADIDALFRFAQAANLKVIYSLRLENGDPAQDAATAQYVSQNYQPLLANFAIGNEPDIYGGADPRITNFSSYMTDWRSFASAITAAVPGATFGGPDSGSGTSANSWGTRFATDEASAGNVTSTYFHYYAGGSSAGQTVQQLIDGMLSAYWTKTDYPAEYSTTGQPVLATGLPYRFTEADAYYTGGGSGVQGGDNCFATALFSLDFMHWWAQQSLSGLNFHTAQWKDNGTLYPDANGNYQVYPVGYGIKAFDLGGHGYVEPVAITNPNGSNVTAYAVGSGQDTYVTIVNKTHSPYLNSVDAVVTIQPSGVAAASASEIVLAGDTPGDGASLTATLGGAAIPDNTRWQGQWVPLPPEANGSVTLTVPTATAAVVRIHAASNYAGPIQMDQNGALEVFGFVPAGNGRGQSWQHGAGFGHGWVPGQDEHDGGDVWHDAQTASDVPNSALNNWNGWEDLTGGVESRGGAAVAKNLDNTLEVFVPATTGDVFFNRQLTPGSAWSGWTDMGSSSQGMVNLQTANNADGSLTVVGVGTNGDLWYSTQSAPNAAWSAWSDLTGKCIQPGFVLGQNLNGDLELFGADSERHIWTSTQTAAGGWGSWAALSGPPLNPKLAIARNVDGRLELFGVDERGDLWHTSQTSTGGSWSGWAAIGGRQIEPGFVIGQNSDGRLAVFGVDARPSGLLPGQGRPAGRKDVWSISQQSAGAEFAGPWSDLGGPEVDPRLVIGNTLDGRLQLFSTGENGDVWSNWQVSGGGAWAGWSDFGGRGTQFYSADRTLN